MDHCKQTLIEYLSTPFQIKGPYWICGIEPGSGSNVTAQTWEAELRKELATPHPPILPSKISCLREYHYGRAHIAVCASYKGLPGTSLDNSQAFLEGLGFEVTCFNLYPFPFPDAKDRHWDTLGASKVTGVQSKLEYRLLCEAHYHKSFRNSLAETSPKWILCAGLTYLERFARAFAGYDFRGFSTVTIGGESPFQIHRIELKHSNTQILVAPHPQGASGLNSNSKRAALGEYLRAISS